MLRIAKKTYSIFGPTPVLARLRLTGRWKLIKEEGRCELYLEYWFLIFREWVHEDRVVIQEVEVNNCGKTTA